MAARNASSPPAGLDRSMSESGIPEGKMGSNPEGNVS